MLAEQRHREILSRLENAGGARVADLAQALAVSEETIRRDLERLSRTGRLLRTHGGAVRTPDERRDAPFDIRQTARHAEKCAIAEAAVAYVNEGDVLALDASSTGHELARRLPDVPLTVLTNSLPAAVMLLGRQQTRVICTGGILEPRSRSLLGSLAEEALRRFHVTKFFLSAKGVCPRRGLSEASDDQARFKQALLDLADQSYLLVDSSKLGVRSVVFYAGVADVDLLITDAAANAAILRELEQLGLRTQLAPDAK